MNPPRDWKAIAQALRIEIPEPALSTVAQRLDNLEQAFAPLARTLTFEQEPALTFRADPEEE